MKVLYLVRHAQSSWNDAAKMGKRLAESELAVDAILSSPAKRALATAETIARKLDFKREKIVQDERLCTGQVDDLLLLIQEIGSDHKRVMLVDHNPLLSELLLRLSGKDTNLPTCAVAVLKFDTKSWVKIGRKKLEKVAIKYA